METLNRADYRGLNFEVYKRRPDGHFGEQLSSVWVVRSQEGERFDVNKKGLSWDEQYPKLAEVLEKRSGKKGLTIVVY